MLEFLSIADGLHDLGSLVESGLQANGWDWLAHAYRANDSGQILGYGKLSSQSGGQMTYLLTPHIEGDYNEDGTVDAADYAVWRDSMSDVPRYNEWKSNFGDTAEESGSAANGAVPEPSSIALTGLAIGGLFLLRLRRTQKLARL